MRAVCISILGTQAETSTIDVVALNATLHLTSLDRGNSSTWIRGLPGLVTAHAACTVVAGRSTIGLFSSAMHQPGTLMGWRQPLAQPLDQLVERLSADPASSP
jgi:hypothetical protein